MRICDACVQRVYPVVQFGVVFGPWFLLYDSRVNALNVGRETITHTHTHMLGIEDSTSCEGFSFVGHRVNFNDDVMEVFALPCLLFHRV